MSEYGDMCKELRDNKREARALFGIPCEGCRKMRPKAEPTIMMPQRKCKVCGNQDHRTWRNIAVDLQRQLDEARELATQERKARHEMDKAWRKQLAQLQQENGRLRKALEFYAKGKHMGGRYKRLMQSDCYVTEDGYKAMAALSAQDDISANTLAMIDKSAQNFKDGNVSEPVEDMKHDDNQPQKLSQTESCR